MHGLVYYNPNGCHMLFHTDRKHYRRDSDNRLSVGYRLLSIHCFNLEGHETGGHYFHTEVFKNNMSLTRCCLHFFHNFERTQSSDNHYD